VPPAVENRRLIAAYSFLNRAVVIRIEGQAAFAGALEKRIAQHARPRRRRDRQAALAPAVAIVAVAEAPLGAAKIRQHILVAPARVAALRPRVIVLALSAVVHAAVDGAGAAQGLALRDLDLPPGGARRRLRFELPRYLGIEQSFDEARRNLDEAVGVRRPRLQDQHRVTAAARQALGQNAAGGAAADDHVVKTFHIAVLIPISPKFSCRWAPTIVLKSV
jgi:hypothetical protein